MNLIQVEQCCFSGNEKKGIFSDEKQVYNPFLPIYECVPDGEPHVFGDRVYLYGSHDKEGGETFCMLDYTTYSAPVTDLSDWRCEGTIYRADQDPAYPTDRKFMYAPDVVQGNDGRFYLYYCMSGRAGFGGYNGPISVAVSDSPAGPFRYLGFVHYPDGSPMLNYICFDPGVINDDGTIRIYYGTWSDEALDKDFPNHEEAIQTVMQRYHKSRNEVLQTEGSVMGPCTVTVGDDMLTVTSEPRHIIPAYTIGTSFEEHRSLKQVPFARSAASIISSTPPGRTTNSAMPPATCRTEISSLAALSFPTVMSVIMAEVKKTA